MDERTPPAGELRPGTVPEGLPSPEIVARSSPRGGTVGLMAVLVGLGVLAAAIFFRRRLSANVDDVSLLRW